ncbi:MAG: hypothetical protein ABEJ74_01555 [Haloferacaceae archaeon]
MHYGIVYWAALAVVGAVLTLVGAIHALTAVSVSALLTVLGGLVMVLSSVGQLRLEEWGAVDPGEKRWHAVVAVAAAVVSLLGLGLLVLG